MKKWKEKAKKTMRDAVKDVESAAKVLDRQREIGARKERLRLEEEQRKQSSYVVPILETEEEAPASLNISADSQKELFINKAIALYIECMSNDGVYGGDIEIKAIAEIFQRPIEIWSKNTHADNRVTYDRNSYSIATPAFVTNNTPVRLLLHYANTEGAHYIAINPNFAPTTDSSSDIEPSCLEIEGDGNCLFAASYAAVHFNDESLSEFLPVRARELREAVYLQLVHDQTSLKELFNNLLRRAQEDAEGVGFANIFGELPNQRGLRHGVQELLRRYYPSIIFKEENTDRSDSDTSESSSSTLDEFEALGIHRHLLSFDAHDAEVSKFLNDVTEKYIDSLGDEIKTGGIIELAALADLWDCKIELSVYKEQAVDINSTTKPIFETVFVKNRKDKDKHQFTISLQLVCYGSKNSGFNPLKINEVKIDPNSVIEKGNLGLFEALTIARTRLDINFQQDQGDLCTDIKSHLKQIIANSSHIKCLSIWHKQDNLIAHYFKGYIYALEESSQYCDLLAECSLKEQALQLRNVRKLLLKFANELITTVTQQVKDEVATWHISGAFTPTQRLRLEDGEAITAKNTVSLALHSLQHGCKKLGNSIIATKSTLYTNATKQPVNFIYMTVTSALSMFFDYMSEYWYSITTLPNHTMAVSISRALNFLGNMVNVYAGFMDDMKHIETLKEDQLNLIQHLPVHKLFSIAFVTNNKITKYFGENECKNLSTSMLKEYWQISDKIEFVITGSTETQSITHAEISLLTWLYERWAYALISISSMAQVSGTAVTLLSLQKQLDACEFTQGNNLAQELYDDSDVSDLFNVTYTPTMSPTIDFSSTLITPQTVNMNLALTGLNYVLWNFTQISGPIHKYDFELTNALLAITEAYKNSQANIHSILANMLITYSADAEMVKALSEVPNNKKIKRGVRKTIELLKKNVKEIERLLNDRPGIAPTTRSVLSELSATIAILNDRDTIYDLLNDNDSSLELLDKTKKLSEAIIDEEKNARSNTDAQTIQHPSFRRLSSSLYKTIGALSFLNRTKTKNADNSSAPANNEEQVDETSALTGTKQTSASIQKNQLKG